MNGAVTGNLVHYRKGVAFSSSTLWILKSEQLPLTGVVVLLTGMVVEVACGGNSDG